MLHTSAQNNMYNKDENECQLKKVNNNILNNRYIEYSKNI